MNAEKKTIVVYRTICDEFEIVCLMHVPTNLTDSEVSGALRQVGYGDCNWQEDVPVLTLTGEWQEVKTTVFKYRIEEAA